jgi:DNA polymerase III subunit gamma/tau
VWPDVLARIFTMRRVTWTFLSQHAQVIHYDGNRLVLGIATVGLTNTFRAGNHAELVRQALIDEIGVDVPVEGVPMSEAAEVVGSSGGRPGADSGSGSPRPAPTPAEWPEPSPEPEPWPEPPPESDSEPGDRPPADPVPVNGSSARPTAKPDDHVSDDDEDIAPSPSDGRAVVERVLGGQFLGELEE